MVKKQFLALPPAFYFQHAVLSHRGQIRRNNEDRLAAKEFVADDSAHTPVFLSVLCDGVGGHPGGEVAAQIGVNTILETVSECKSLEDPRETLRSAIVAANLAVLDSYTIQPELDGMAATCISFLIVGDRLFLANLGDSRAYLFRKNQLSQLSYDHTWLEEMAGLALDGRRISREHPLAHVLSRYLGVSHPADVDLRLRNDSNFLEATIEDQGLRLNHGDCLLLCSDGLTDVLTDTEIAGCLCGVTPVKIAQRLVSAALEKGGHDNVSVIVTIIG